MSHSTYQAVDTVEHQDEPHLNPDGSHTHPIEQEIHSPSPDYFNSPNSTSSQVQSSSSQTYQQTQSSSSNPARQTQSDGVFSNLTAKQKNFEEIEPPSYSSAVHPATTDITFVPTVTSQFYSVSEESGEVLVEGIEVGNLFILFLNMLISMTFDLVGFFV
jgi:Protein of unknown function (DUF2370)